MWLQESKLEPQVQYRPIFIKTARIGHAFNKSIDLGFQHQSKLHYENEIISNFPLQMALYFNIVFFPVWLTTIIVMLPLKYDKLPDLFKIILIIAVIASILIEATRLYMGYLGNLTKNIPGLAGFWMLSLLLQTPLQILLLHSALSPSLVEYVVQGIMCCLLATQLLTGFTALRDFAKHSSARFHMEQFIFDTTKENEET